METWGVEMENQSLLGYMVLANSGEFVLRLFLVSWYFLTAPVRRLSSRKSLLLPSPLLPSLPLHFPLIPFPFLPSSSLPLPSFPSLWSWGWDPGPHACQENTVVLSPRSTPLWFFKGGGLTKSHRLDLDSFCSSGRHFCLILPSSWVCRPMIPVNSHILYFKCKNFKMKI